MALNANKVPSNKVSNFEPMEAGTYPARLVSVIDLGLQAQRAYKGEEKDPQISLAYTYELLDEFMKNEDGTPDLTKPRWITEILPFYNLTADKAKATKRYLALDPQQVHGGDWTQLIGTPVMVTVVLNLAKDGSGKIYENIGAVALMRSKDAEKAAPLVNQPVTFDTDNPDLDMWKRVPAWLQKIIRGGLNFKGSALSKLVGDAPADTNQAQSPPVQKGKPALKVVPKSEDDDIPY